MERGFLKFTGALVLSLLFTVGAPLFADCESAFAKLGSIPPWTNKDKNLKLNARDLFPEDFVSEIESTLGAFDIRVAHHPLQGFLSIAGVVRSSPCVRVKLFEDPERPQSMIVDDLTLEDPRRSKDSSHLNPDQVGKGLPPSVFRHVKERLFEIVKAGGYQEIRTHSQQHFSVVQLYKRFVGMEPSNEQSKKTLDFLESLYSFSRKELPEELRPKDVEEFTRWIGSVGSDPSGLTKTREILLKSYFELGVVHPSLSLLKNKKGEVIGALFNDSERAASKIVFFDLTQDKPQILHWLRIALSHQLELVRKF